MIKTSNYIFSVHKVPVCVAGENKKNQTMTYVCTFKTSPVCKFNTFVFLLIIDRFSFSGTGFIITENGLSKINKKNLRL